MALRRKPGSRVWLYQCKIDGKTWCRTTGQTDKRKAQREVPRLARLAELHRTRPSESLRLSKAIVREVARVEEDVSANQAVRVSYGLLRFLKYADDLFLEVIDATLVEKFQRKRLKEAARSTVDKEICYLLCLLRMNGILVPRPSPKRGRVTEQRPFTAEEINRFFEVCPERLRLYYAMLLVTGARPAELIPSKRSMHVALLKKEIDLEKGECVIRSAKTRSGKRGKVRHFPIPPELIEPLRTQIESVKGPHIFRPMTNGPRDFDSVLEEADIPKFDELGSKLTADSFRHTYATLLAKHVGHNPFVLKEVLGHSRISMSERYCHATGPSLELVLSGIKIPGFGPSRGAIEGCQVEQNDTQDA